MIKTAIVFHTRPARVLWQEKHKASHKASKLYYLYRLFKLNRTPIIDYRLIFQPLTPDLNDGVEETHSKYDLPPFPAKDVFLKERTAELSKGASHTGTETLRGLDSNLSSQ